MKDRLLTLLGAVIAFYILIQLFFPGIGLEPQKISYPTSIDRGKYGLAGLYQWLGTQHVPVYSLRRRYSVLDRNKTLSKQGNLLIISLPLRINAQALELKNLRSWVAQGNNVLFLVAMSDWPQWANRLMSNSVIKVLNDFNLCWQINAQTQQHIKASKSYGRHGGAADKTSALLHPVSQVRHLIPALANPLTAGVQQVQVNWLSSEGKDWHLSPRRHVQGSLILLRDKNDDSPGLWVSHEGKGDLLISSYSDLFGNGSLGLADNAKLMRNIVQQLVDVHGKVIFDDMHQGLSALYDPHAFFHDPRLHHTLLFLLALWLIYVMGHSNRFIQIRQRRFTLQLCEHVQAIGSLFARRLHPSAAAIRVAQHFFNEVRANYAMPLNGQPVWEQLSQNTAVEPTLLQRAQTLYQQAVAGKRINLVNFVNILKIMRRELQ